jgi:hypothetical protein
MVEMEMRVDDKVDACGVAIHRLELRTDLLPRTSMVYSTVYPSPFAVAEFTAILVGRVRTIFPCRRG